MDKIVEDLKKRGRKSPPRASGNVQREGMPGPPRLRHEPRKGCHDPGSEPSLFQVLACGEGRCEVEQREGPSSLLHLKPKTMKNNEIFDYLESISGTRDLEAGLDCR